MPTPCLPGKRKLSAFHAAPSWDVTPACVSARPVCRSSNWAERLRVLGSKAVDFACVAVDPSPPIQRNDPGAKISVNPAWALGSSPGRRSGRRQPTDLPAGSHAIRRDRRRGRRRPRPRNRTSCAPGTVVSPATSILTATSVSRLLPSAAVAIGRYPAGTRGASATSLPSVSTSARSPRRAPARQPQGPRPPRRATGILTPMNRMCDSRRCDAGACGAVHLAPVRSQLDRRRSSVCQFRQTWLTRPRTRQARSDGRRSPAASGEPSAWA